LSRSEVSSELRRKFTLSRIVIFVVFLTLALLAYLGSRAGTAAAEHTWSGDFSKTEYSKYFDSNCDKNSNLTIGLLNPTFTAAADNHAFYEFYDKHNLEISDLKSVKQDLDLLTSEVPNSTAMTPLNNLVKLFPQRIEELVPHAGICILDDRDVHTGNVDFIQGISSREGWHGDSFIIRTDRHTSHKINLDELVRERNNVYSQTSGLQITIPPDTVVNPFEFDANIIESFSSASTTMEPT
jgi:hypothetical protein